MEIHSADFYKYETCKLRDPFLSYRPFGFFIGESRVCKTTKMSGARDSAEFDDTTLLIDLGCTGNVCVSCYNIVKICSYDRILDFISLLGNKMVPTTIAVGKRCTQFFLINSILMKKNKIEEGTFLNSPKR